MTRVGVVGLGVMGLPMALNLAKAGFEVAGYDRDSFRQQPMLALGGRAATGLHDTVERAEVVLTVLPDSPDVEEVVLGDRGHLGQGAGGPPVRRLQYRATGNVGRGGPSNARPRCPPPGCTRKRWSEGCRRGDALDHGRRGEGRLPCRKASPRCRRQDRRQGGRRRCRTDGEGREPASRRRIIELVSEALVLIEASGIDPGPALEVLGGGLAGNRVLDIKSKSLVARDFRPGFRIDLHHKDMGIALAAARQAGVSLPVTALVAQLIAAVCANGGGNLDHSPLLGLVEQLSGRRQQA